MVQSFGRRARRLRAVYRQGGLTESTFSAARHVGKRLLPEPHATRFRYRTELVQGALTGAAGSRLPVHLRIELALAGFTERLYFAYGFDRGVAPDPYLSEYARKCARSINDRPNVLRDKEVFQEYLTDHGLGSRLPRMYGTIVNGTFHGCSDDIASLAKREGPLVVKGAVGGGGHQVYFVEAGSDGTTVRGPENELHDPDTVLPQLDRAIVTKRCTQAEYLDRISPETPNTLRVLTMNPDDGRAFIPAATQRFGTAASGALDNFSQGGLSALVDVDTGRMSRSARLGSNHRPQWHATHPDTGTPIEGTTVPRWSAIRNEIREIAGQLPGLSYVGWDLLATSPGEFVILEGNHFPDPDLIQVHRPLLEDLRVRRFFDAHGVPT